jgi:hypothetical protein
MAAPGVKFCVLEYHTNKSVITVQRMQRTRLHDLADLKARIIATVKNTDAPMLTRVWLELEYRIDVCRVTRGAHVEHLLSSQKTFSVFLWCEQFH